MSNDWITWNTGEWSELYALAFILTFWGMFGADKHQHKKEDLFYRVVEVFLEWKNSTLQYVIFDGYIEIYNGDNYIGRIETSDLKNNLRRFFVDLSANNDWRAYALESWSELLELLKSHWIKASSHNKKDIDLVLLDSLTKNTFPRLGFSIKSQLWTPSTLLNASKATNFIYEILDQDWNIPLSLPTLHEKNVKDNISTLLEMGYRIVFRNIESSIFEQNLGLIDSRLSEYISQVLLWYYSRNGTKVSELTEFLFLGNHQAKHKLKEFIAIMTMWMMPNTQWDGNLPALGGIILVKKDGDVLCYYLYNLKDFQEYLFDNVKLDTPSTTRYGIGKIITDWWKYYIKLNLQIRFLK